MYVAIRTSGRSSHGNHRVGQKLEQLDRADATAHICRTLMRSKSEGEKEWRIKRAVENGGQNGQAGGNDRAGRI